MNQHDFYNQNKDFKPVFPEIPKHLTSDIEITRWVFEQKVPYIELDIKFNPGLWKSESVLAEPYLVKHRESQDHNGWMSCCIHGIDTSKTGIWHVYSETEPEYKWTDLSEKTPIIKQFWQDFPFERYARIRFMQLLGNGHVYPHNDNPGEGISLLEHLVPINIAIDHPDNCYMVLKNHGIVPWSNGDIKIVNITNDHSVVNYNSKPRMHMIAHGYIGNKIHEFSKLIARSYRKQYERYRVPVEA